MNKIFLLFFSLVIPKISLAVAYSPLVNNVQMGSESLKTQQGFPVFLDSLFQIGVAIAVILAVIMVVIGGIEYMVTDSPFGKGDAKGRIGAAIGGLVLALSTILIFNEINPDIATTNLEVPKVIRDNWGVFNYVGDPGLFVSPEYFVDDDGNKVQTGDLFNSEDFKKLQEEGVAFNEAFQKNNNSVGVMPGQTSAKMLYLAKQAANKGLLTSKIPDTDDGRLACAAVVSTIISQSTGEKFYTLGTNELDNYLRKNPRFQRVSFPQAGDIVVSPSGKKSGHTGIVSSNVINGNQETVKIISNSTNSQKVEENYNLNSWVEEYKVKRGLEVFFYRPVY